MSKVNSFETKLLNLLFKNTDAANIGDAGGLRGSVSAGNLYISLHTADPGEAGSQVTSEATYTGYARAAVARGAGFTVADNQATNAAEIAFAECTAETNTITHFGVGVNASGAGELIYYGALTASLAVSAGITPKIQAGTLAITED